MASMPLQVWLEAAHNPVAAGPRVQIPPPQPISLHVGDFIAFTF
jgi:hypothetical protein